MTSVYHAGGRQHDHPRGIPRSAWEHLTHIIMYTAFHRNRSNLACGSPIPAGSSAWTPAGLRACSEGSACRQQAASSICACLRWYLTRRPGRFDEALQVVERMNLQGKPPERDTPACLPGVSLITQCPCIRRHSPHARKPLRGAGPVRSREGATI